MRRKFDTEAGGTKAGNHYGKSDEPAIGGRSEDDRARDEAELGR